MFLESNPQGLPLYGEPQVKPLEPWQQRLLAAADLIEKCGHAQGESRSPTGGYCSVAALYHVNGKRFDFEVEKRMEKAVFGPNGIVLWNDRTPAAEVVRVMREVARG